MSAPVVVVQQPPPGAPVAAYAMHQYVLPVQYRQVSLAISITILCTGFVSILIGGVSFASYGYWYYLSVLTGVDFWVGASVIIVF